jgi:multiple sugar transport system permease protein
MASGRPGRPLRAVVAGRALTYLTLAGASALLFLPMLWAITGSLKSSGVLYTYPPELLPREWHFENYAEVFAVVPFLLFTRNSFAITGLALAGQVLSSSLVAYGFARFAFRGRNGLFVLLLSTMMLPPQVILIPQYLLFAKLGWIDSWKPLIVPFWFAHAFSVFLLRQFMLTIPTDFDHAATIDGASRWKIFWLIMLPLIKPALIAIAIFGFRSHWNSFINPLIYLNTTEKYTLQLGLSYIKSNYMVDSGGRPHENWLMAASLMVTAPSLLVFFVLQRYFVQGVVMSGLKQ